MPVELVWIAGILVLAIGTLIFAVVGGGESSKRVD